MKPGEKRDMAVVFYVDPKLAKDSEQDDAQHHHALLHLLSGADAGTAGGGEREHRKNPDISDSGNETARTARTAAPRWRR